MVSKRGGYNPRDRQGNNKADYVWSKKPYPAFQKKKKEVVIAERAVSSALVHKRQTQVLDLMGQLIDPDTEQALVSYTVKNGEVVEVDGISVVYSEPLIERTFLISWHLLIGGASIPTIKPSLPNTDSNKYYFGLGSLHNPFRIGPIYAQSGQAVEIRVYPHLSFNDHISLFGRLIGNILKTSTSESRL